MSVFVNVFRVIAILYRKRLANVTHRGHIRPPLKVNTVVVDEEVVEIPLVLDFLFFV